MTKTTKKVRIGDGRHGYGRYKYRIILTDDGEYAEGSAQSRIRASGFLQEVARSVELLYCGFNVFREVKMKHTGICWQIESEAEVEEAEAE